MELWFRSAKDGMCNAYRSLRERWPHTADDLMALLALLHSAGSPDEFDAVPQLDWNCAEVDGELEVDLRYGAAILRTVAIGVDGRPVTELSEARGLIVVEVEGS